jgi:hypothetical protein
METGPLGMGPLEQGQLEVSAPAAPVRVVEGRVIVSPTHEQVVATLLGRPSARADAFAHGLTHALRPESRDRIRALMKREFRRRRKERLRAGRRAAQLAPLSDGMQR